MTHERIVENQPSLWTTSQVAKYYGVSTRTISRWRKAHAIASPVVSTRGTVRWNPADLLALNGRPLVKLSTDTSGHRQTNSRDVQKS